LLYTFHSNYERYTETRSLVPNVLLEDSGIFFTADVNISLRLIGYNGICTSQTVESTTATKCQKKITYKTESILAFTDDVGFTCLAELDDNQKVIGCYVRLFCGNCSIAADTSSAFVTINVGGNNVYARGLEYAVNISSAYVDVYNLDRSPQRSVSDFTFQ